MTPTCNCAITLYNHAFIDYLKTQIFQCIFYGYLQNAFRVCPYKFLSLYCNLFIGCILKLDLSCDNFYRKKFIFAAFNKTGGTSIESALRQYQSRYARFKLKIKRNFLYPDNNQLKHLPPAYIKKLTGEHIWNSYFTFAFVRNPYNRIVSLYFFHRKRPEKYPKAQKSFEEWVMTGGTGTVKNLCVILCVMKKATL